MLGSVKIGFWPAVHLLDQQRYPNDKLHHHGQKRECVGCSPDGSCAGHLQRHPCEEQPPCQRDPSNPTGEKRGNHQLGHKRALEFIA